MNAIELVIKGNAKDATAALDSVNKAQKDVKASALTLSDAYTAVGSAIAAAGLVAFTGQLVNAQVAIDRVNASLRTTFGNEAAGEMAFLTAEADRLGLALIGTAESYGKIAAAAKGTSMEGSQTREIFLGVTEAATALGLSADSTNGMLNALQQMMSKGNVQAEELRGQLGERLPGAFSLAAKAMGVTEIQLNKMLDRGEVLATDLLPKLATALREKYGQAAVDAANNAQQALNRYDNAWQEMLRTVGNSAPLVGGINAGTEALKLLTEHADAAAFAMTAMGAAAVVQNIGAITTAMRALAASTALATGGITLLTGAVAVLAFEGGQMLAESFDDATVAIDGSMEMMKSHGNTAATTAAVIKLAKDKESKAVEDAAKKEKEALKERLADNKETAKEIVKAETNRFQALAEMEKSFAATVKADLDGKRAELQAFRAEVSALRATMAAEDAAIEAQRNPAIIGDAYTARLNALDALGAKERKIDEMTDPAEKARAYAALRTEWAGIATAVEQDNVTLISKEQAIYDVQDAHERLRAKVEEAAIAEANEVTEQTRALEDKWNSAGQALSAYEDQVRGLDQLLTNLSGKEVVINFRATGVEQLYGAGGMAGLGSTPATIASASTPWGGSSNYFSDAGNAPVMGEIPGFAVGTNYVARGGLAVIHKGEAIIPADQNKPGAGGGVTIGSLSFSLPNVTNQSTARDLAREAVPEIMRLMKLANGGR